MKKSKTIIAYIGGLPYPQEFDKPWGGSVSTNYCYRKAFENDPEYEIHALGRDDIEDAEQIEKFIKSVNADIVHVDDTSILGICFQGGLAYPDVIGPLSRSPTKVYNKGEWVCPYEEDWFYSAKVIRLNHFEERKTPERVTLVIHGVDSEMLKSVNLKRERKVILWAGQRARPAKNADLWDQITKIDAPKGYKYKTMSKYNVEDYWKELDNVAVLVNTSKSETFCCAAFEAMARGIPVIWRKNLQGGKVHETAGIRVDYDGPGFHEGIRRALQDLKYHAVNARRYVEDNCTLKHMRDSYVKIYEQLRK